MKLNPEAYPVWSCSVSLPSDTSFEYKYICRAPNAPVIWEDPPFRNRASHTPEAPIPDDKLDAIVNFTIRDAWY